MSTYSSAFIAAARRPAGWIKLGVRLPLSIILLVPGLLGFLLQWLGTLGESLVEFAQDWKHEVWAVTTPPVWTELKALAARADRAEADASAMRDICRDHEASLKRARDICFADDIGEIKGMEWPVIQWPAAVAAPAPTHQPEDTTETLSPTP